MGDKGKDNPAVDDEGEGSLTGIPAVKKFETEMGDDDFEEVGPSYQLGSPEDSASFLSKLVVGYADPLLNRACKKTLTEKDLWGISYVDESHQLYENFQEKLENTMTNENPYGRVAQAMLDAVFPRFFIAGVLQFFFCIAQFISPVILQAILYALQPPIAGPLYLFGLSTALFVVTLLETALVNWQFHMSFRVGMHLKVVGMQMVYDKLTRLSTSAKSKMGSGAIQNLQSNDTNRISLLPRFGHNLWSGPFQITVFIALLVGILGWLPALGGMATVLGLTYLNSKSATELGKAARKAVVITDKRVKVAKEIVSGIKAIKLYAWEEPYKKRVVEFREAELKQVETMTWLQGILSINSAVAAVIVPVVMFGIYTAQGRLLTPAVAFPALFIVQLIRFPLAIFPAQLGLFVTAEVSVKRLQEFLELEETNHADMDPRPAVLGEPSISVERGSFSWAPGAEKPVLQDINIKLFPGELLVIIGEVGSGKSTLLQSLIGETIKYSGDVDVRGEVAYTSQDPWIQNMTVRDNILWGRKYNPVVYQRTLEACALESDLKVLVAGDQTEIGAKGINLSGGQKHRVALARAVYARADVYLLDDPLSAVDAHVGSHLFNHCICGVLSNTTRVLVTHQVQFASNANKVAVMREGQIEHFGTYQELVAKGVNLQQFTLATSDDAASDDTAEGSDSSDTKVIGGKTPEESRPTSTTSSPPSEGQQKLKDPASGLVKKAREGPVGSLVAKAESKTQGRLGISVYLRYFNAWGSFYILPILLTAFVFVERGFQQVQNWWISVWSNVGIGLGGAIVYSNLYYFTILTIIAVISVIGSVLKTLVTAKGANAASRKLHQQLLDRVLSLPMSFHDTQPVSRLMNRFTKDVNGIDTLLVSSLSTFTVNAATGILSILVIIGVSPWLLIAIPFLFVIYWSVLDTYSSASVELKRLDSTAYSPIFAHFGETESGLSTIRAFRRTERFREKHKLLLNRSNICMWPLLVISRWLTTRLLLLGAITAYLTALFTTVFFQINAGLAGLAITTAVGLNGILNLLSRGFAELEVQMNAVERIVEYDDEPEEAPAIIWENRPQHDWPSQGIIEVHDLYVRYRDDLDPVINGISFSTMKHEKIGIAGRTGCGKSTLLMSLYRIVEPARGNIYIDGVDILRMGLRDLRSRLALVPQEPVMFSGTIRSNLDPTGLCPDDKMLNALRQVCMLEPVKEMGGLDASVTEEGNNISIGQRQLLGLARAILRDTRILCLDEATSSTDNNTDGLIKTTINTVFADCTVLTIAHRLHTIMNSDRIMILDKGNIAEFDTPQNLLQDKDGLFYGLVDEATKQGAQGMFT